MTRSRPVATGAPRTRRDLCPGVFRPWPASDGALVRLRLVGGRLPVSSLPAAAELARRWGDGMLHLTRRANLQLRALPAEAGVLPAEVVDAIAAAGLLPSRSHELVRNVMASPQTGLAGGRADLGPVAAALDEQLCADPSLAALPGRFLLVLDDGRGDLLDLDCDLGVVAIDGTSAQLRVGDGGWGEVVPLDEAAAALADLARAFLQARGTGSTAAWHVRELAAPIVALQPRHPRTDVSSPRLPYGRVPGGVHVEVPGGVLDRDRVDDLVSAAGRAGADTLVVTPWHGVLVPVVTD
ncbi:MAG: nitrite reductase [Nocardioidaceae bacterium]